jgi:hypothetical protein
MLEGMAQKKPTKKDKAWQEKIEKVKLDHPRGKERFERLIRKLKKDS